MALPVLCPICAATFPPALRAGRQLCPNCHARLTLRRRYALVMVFVVSTISVLIAAAIGVPRAWMLLAVALIQLPVQFIVMSITVRLFAVELEPSGGFRGLLYEDRETLAGGTPDTPTPSPEVHFAASRGSWTLEDVMIAIFLATIALGFGYWSLSPLVAKVYPEFGATRTGPDGFPVTMHIGHRLIAFTNGSAVQWTCNAALMKQGRPVAGAVFLVEAGRTHGVFYSDFLDTHGLSDEALEESAREGVDLLCREPSGRRHSATLATLQQYIR